MTAMAHDTQAHHAEAHEDFLLQDFLALETPEGYRAELIDGEIVVSPPPFGNHEKNIAKVVSQIIRKSSIEVDTSSMKGLKVPSGGGCTKNHVIPDLTVAPEELDVFGDAAPWMEPEGVALVMEVTSDHPERDREAKRHCYARSGIPLYLLVDRTEAKVTLFSSPENDDYVELVQVNFGKTIALPKPFEFELDTSKFV
ncbi:Uma2 family endonuclease [Actinomadura macrotermitis]|uniref:Putative restriction endonuclease domain-containing protein n=1 Tax=Actinomadura macrotermitis TaxID=2585200 RepID=A0A7K0C7V3_9ACTN|nr:Uma2 family endonuclease [Actinomadura macrotermitis]MQY09530.1 hypothetical protein [Actinomadura macrotermitis]